MIPLWVMAGLYLKLSGRSIKLSVDYYCPSSNFILLFTIVKLYTLIMHVHVFRLPMMAVYLHAALSHFQQFSYTLAQVFQFGLN